MRDVLLLLLGAVLGWLSQWLFYGYQRRDERGQGPNLVVSTIQRDERTLVELRNIGTDTLAEMDVKFSWLEGSHRRELVVLDFFRGSEGPQRLEVIGNGETVQAAGLPKVSDDGIVDVQITGLGARSQHLFSAVSQVVVGRRVFLA